MSDSVTQREFDTWAAEHQKYLDEAFGKVFQKVESINGAVTCVKDDQTADKKELEEKITVTRKIMVVGLAVCFLLAGAQIPAVQAVASIILKAIF